MKFTDRVKEFVYRQQFPSNEFGKEGWEYIVSPDRISVSPRNADGSFRESFEMNPATAQKIEVLRGDIQFHDFKDALPFENLKEVSGDFYVGDSILPSLPEHLEKVDGKFFISESAIESLPETLSYVGDDMVLMYAPISTLPDNLKIEKDLYANLAITTVPSSVEVGGKIEDTWKPYANPDYVYTSDDVASFLNSRGDDELWSLHDDYGPDFDRYLEKVGRFDNVHETNIRNEVDLVFDKNAEKDAEESIDEFIERIGKLDTHHETKTFSNEVEFDDLER